MDSVKLQQYLESLVWKHKIDGKLLEGAYLLKIKEQVEALQQDEGFTLTPETQKLISESHIAYIQRLDEDEKELEETEKLAVELEKSNRILENRNIEIAEQNELLEKQKESVEKDLEQEQAFNLISDKQSRVFQVVKAMVIAVFFFICIYAYDVIINVAEEARKDLKEITLLILGTALGAISSFIGINRNKEKEKDKQELRDLVTKLSDKVK